MAANLDFLSEQFKLFFIHKSPRYFLPSFESTGLSVQEKKHKIDFQDGSNLGDLSYLLSTSPLYVLRSLESNGQGCRRSSDLKAIF